MLTNYKTNIEFKLVERCKTTRLQNFTNCEVIEIIEIVSTYLFQIEDDLMSHPPFIAWIFNF